MTSHTLIFLIGKLVNVLGQVNFINGYYEDINKVYWILVTPSSPQLDRTLERSRPDSHTVPEGTGGRQGNSFFPSTQLADHVVPQKGRQVMSVSLASARKSRGISAREHTLGLASSRAGSHPAPEEGLLVNFWESRQGAPRGGGEEPGGPEEQGTSRKPSASPAPAAPSSTHSVGGPNSLTRLLSL